MSYRFPHTRSMDTVSIIFDILLVCTCDIIWVIADCNQRQQTYTSRGVAIFYMQKVVLPISITMLALGLIFAGVSYTSSGLIQGWANKIYSAPVEEDAIIFFDDFGSSEDDSSEGGSAMILGESTPETPSPAPKQQQYQYQAPLPTSTPAPEVVVQQAQEQKTPWDGYANKEAFCKDIADRVMQQPLPEIDQSNLPPELWFTPDLDAMWKDAYQSCMNKIRDY